MSVYVVTRKSDAVEVFRFSASSLFEYPGYPFVTHTYSVWSEAPAAPGPVRVTRLAFRQRFTTAERVAIEIAALDRTDATDEQRAQAAALRSYQEDVNVSEHIDLNDADTRAGVADLEGVGLLAPGRTAVILDTEPTAEERWNG